MAHDGSEGLSPDGWLPDRISVGVLTRAFPPELVDEIIEVTGTREQRRRLLPARLMVYFVLALWLFRGRNCGYGQVMAKLADGLYGQRRGADLLAGKLAPGGRVDAGQGRQWWLPNISSLSRGRGKLGADPVRMLFERVAGPTAAAGAPGVFCCGLRVVSMDGSVTDVPDSEKNAAFFGRPSNQSRDGAFPQARWVAAAESGTGSLLGAAIGRYTDAEQPLAADLLGCFGPGMLVLADRKFLSWSAARAFLATGAHILWRASASFALRAGESPGRRYLPCGTEAAPQERRPAGHRPRHRVHRTYHGRRRRRADLRSVLPGHQPARCRGVPGAGPGLLLPAAGGDARPSSATTRPTWEKASPSCAPAIPRASCRRCGHCSPSTRPSAGSSA